MAWKQALAAVARQLFRGRAHPVARPRPLFRPTVTRFEDRLAPAVVAQWNFNSPTPDGSYATGTTAPAVGFGTLFPVGGTTTSFNQGSINNGSSDPNTGDDTGLNVIGFPAQGERDRAAGLGLTVDTRGYRDVRLSFDQRNSNTASNTEVVQYSTDGGATWADAQTLVMGRGESWATGRTVDLSGVAGAADNPALGLRIVSAANGTGYAASEPGSNYTTRGTWRFDMVAVTGTETAAAEASAVADSRDGWAFGLVEVARAGGDVSRSLRVTVDAAKADGQGGYGPPVTREVVLEPGQATAQVVVVPTPGLPADAVETYRVTVRGGAGAAEVVVTAHPEAVMTFPISTNPALSAIERLKSAVQDLKNLRGKLTPDQWEKVLDLTQLTLDLVGIFEPTPVADGISAAISVYRKDYLGAGLSVLGFIPYVGDLGKLGKIPGYVAKASDAVKLAAKDYVFAKTVRPLLEAVRDLLNAVPVERLPLDQLPAGIGDAILGVRNGVVKATTKLDLIDELAAKGIKHTPENIVEIGKDATGKVVFLETGNAKGGLQHILDGHKRNFADRGVTEEQIPELLIRAATEGKVVGQTGTGANVRNVYELNFNGVIQRLVVGVSENGFIVTAHPF